MGFRLFVSAGEASGDRHAAALVRALRQRVGDLELRGLGGPALEAEGMELLAHIRDLSALGFAEVIRRLPFFKKTMAMATREIRDWKPDLVLPVDYPGFNLRLSRRVRRDGGRVAYYIAPQVWAWKRERRPGIREAVDRLLVVFPFEESLFREAGIPTTFVGHPLLDEEADQQPPEEVRMALGVPDGGLLLAVLPGSRNQEVRHILPPLLEGTRRHLDRGVTVVVSRAPGVMNELYDRVGGPVRLWDGPAAALTRAADAALVASGTATLETGLMGTPLGVVYRTNWFNWHIARAVVSLRTIGLVNIAAGGDRIPELLQGDLSAIAIHDLVERLLHDSVERREQEAYLAPLRARLGGEGAADRAAEEVARMLRKGDGR